MNGPEPEFSGPLDRTEIPEVYPDADNAANRPGPYGAAALAYFDGGWPDPIPTSLHKVPLIKGFTGAHDFWPERAIVEGWVEQYRSANIGLRLPKGFLGLDIDRYDGRAGGLTLATLKRRLGPLPATHVSTSRHDGSGVHIYRLPDGFDGAEFADPGPGIEVVKWCHRHVQAAPSLHHREGRPSYYWYEPSGSGKLRRIDFAPTLEEITTVLPLRWAEGLPKANSAPRAPGESADVEVWLSGRRGAPCRITAATLAHHLSRLASAGPNGGAHSAMNLAIHSLVGDAAVGHRGLRRALVAVRDAYVAAVADRRREPVALKDLRRSLDGDISKREYAILPDPCAGVPNV